MSRFIYADASFNHQHQIAVIGFLVFNSAIEHEIGEFPLSSVNIVQFQEKNNIRAELRASLMGLQSLTESDQMLTLFTDCSAVAKLPQRKHKLRRTNYLSQRKQIPLANADLYELLFFEFERLRPTIQWVKGHSPKTNRSRIQRNFNCIDKLVRKKLREAVVGAHDKPAALIPRIDGRR